MRAADDRGAATVAVLAFVSVLLLLGGAFGVVAAMVHAHRTAQAAADLAALAGAGAQARGRDPCASSDAVATANGARLLTCEVSGDDVRVHGRGHRPAVAGPGGRPGGGCPGRAGVSDRAGGEDGRATERAARRPP